MYKVNQTVKFIHPLRMEDKGKILAKLKVVDSKDGYVNFMVKNK